MANFCRECKEPMRWGTKECPNCGEVNPTGANQGDVLLVTGAIAVGSFVLWVLWKMLLRGGL